MGNEFMLAGDTPFHTKQRETMSKLLYRDEYHQHVKDFYEGITTRLLKDHSHRVGGRRGVSTHSRSRRQKPRSVESSSSSRHTFSDLMANLKNPVYESQSRKYCHQRCCTHRLATPLYSATGCVVCGR